MANIHKLIFEDTVKVKGSDVPLKLFTVDLNIENINKVNTQNKNFIYRLNSLKSSIVSNLRKDFINLSKKTKSEEYDYLNIKVISFI